MTYRVAGRPPGWAPGQTFVCGHCRRRIEDSNDAYLMRQGGVLGFGGKTAVWCFHCTIGLDHATGRYVDEAEVDESLQTLWLGDEDDGYDDLDFEVDLDEDDLPFEDD